MLNHFVGRMLFFFKQKTAYELRISDWSSDVCSSDLTAPTASRPAVATMKRPLSANRHRAHPGCRPDRTTPERPTPAAGFCTGGGRDLSCPEYGCAQYLSRQPPSCYLRRPDRKSTRLNSSH